MSKFTYNKILKYVNISLSLVVAILLCVNIALTFTKAWFTDESPELFEDAKVVEVDIKILQNGTVIGGDVSIDHKDEFIQSDDVYTFVAGTTPVYTTPAIGSSVNVNLEVQNLGWSDGLVRLVGLEIFYIETTPSGGQNEVIATESELTINNGGEVWVSQYVNSFFESNTQPELNPISYNWYLNRLLGENQKATVISSVTNNSINITQYPQFYVRFLAEITVHRANAYITNGDNPPFGPLYNIPSGWTAYSIVVEEPEPTE